MRTLVAAALLAALPFAASAAEGVSYNFVEAGWNRIALDDEWLGDPDGDGAYVRGSWAVGRQVHLFGSYASASESFRLDEMRLKVELRQPEFGIGYHQEFTQQLDFIAELAWTRLEAKARASLGNQSVSASEHTNAGRVAVGLRGTPSPRTELWAKAGYLDGSDVEGSFAGTLGGQVKFNRTWGLVGEVEVIEDTTRYNVGVRASF